MLFPFLELMLINKTMGGAAAKAFVAAAKPGLCFFQNLRGVIT